jgi:hypothetical protein
MNNSISFLVSTIFSMSVHKNQSIAIISDIKNRSINRIRIILRHHETKNSWNLRSSYYRSQQAQLASSLSSSSRISFIQIKISSFDSIDQGKIKNNTNAQIDSSKELEIREIFEISRTETIIEVKHRVLTLTRPRKTWVTWMTKKITRFRSTVQNHR